MKFKTIPALFGHGCSVDDLSSSGYTTDLLVPKI